MQTTSVETVTQDNLAAVLSRYDDAPVSLLRQRDLLDRVDRKFPTTTEVVSRLLEELSGDYQIVLAGGKAWAHYETCYFDTPELFSFREHLRGRRPRFKVRIRHHVERQVSFLEMKRKRSNGKTEKARTTREFRNSVLSGADMAFLRDHCPLPVEGFEQAVWTNFQRATLVGVDTNERMTIDLGLRFERNGLVKPAQRLAIVELKQPRRSQATPAARLLRELRVQESSLSKYCSGVAEVHEQAHPRERKSLTRRLNRITR